MDGSRSESGFGFAFVCSAFPELLLDVSGEERVELRGLVGGGGCEGSGLKTACRAAARVVLPEHVGPARATKSGDGEEESPGVLDAHVVDFDGKSGIADATAMGIRSLVEEVL